MKKSIKIFVFSLIFVLILQACTLEGSVDIGNNNSGNNSNNGNTNNSDDDQVDTDTPEPPPPDATATDTDVPEDTQVPSATTVCDLVEFVKDVNVPDGTKADPGQNFTKTWRLKNAGSCTWTSGYDLVFHSGDSMGAPAAVQLTSGTVAPGGTVDVSVGLTAPTSPGTYKGFFKLRNASGLVFGMPGPFWVEIKVKNPTDTPAPAAAPDLRISFIELIPSTPIQGNTVTVKVQVYNYGNAPAGAFQVVWYPGENYPSPACTWNKSGLVATGGYVLTCTYAGYPSWYSSINTMAIADSLGQVAESNESNNVELMNISVSKP